MSAITEIVEDVKVTSIDIFAWLADQFQGTHDFFRHIGEKNIDNITKNIKDVDGKFYNFDTISRAFSGGIIHTAILQIELKSGKKGKIYLFHGNAYKDKLDFSWLPKADSFGYNRENITYYTHSAKGALYYFVDIGKTVGKEHIEISKIINSFRIIFLSHLQTLTLYTKTLITDLRKEFSCNEVCYRIRDKNIQTIDKKCYSGEEFMRTLPTNIQRLSTGCAISGYFYVGDIKNSSYSYYRENASISLENAFAFLPSTDKIDPSIIKYFTNKGEVFEIKIYFVTDYDRLLFEYNVSHKLNVIKTKDVKNELFELLKETMKKINEIDPDLFKRLMDATIKN